MRPSAHERKAAASQTLKIRIPQTIWNAHEPPHTRVTRSTAKALITQFSTATHRTDRQATTAATQFNARAAQIDESTIERSRPTGCKVKSFSFHYGGPKRVMKGKAMNEIEYSMPCLQLTCKTCLRWHPHIIQEPEPQSETFEQEAYHKPAIEPISPDIDPRIMDGSWQLYESQRNSASSAQSSTQLEMITTPQLTPVKHSFPSEIILLEDSVNPYSPLNQGQHASEWQVSLPVGLVAQATASTCAQTSWRVVPREQYVVRLKFLSHEGKTRFVEFLRKRERKLKKRIYDRERRDRLRQRAAGGGDGSME